MQNLNSINTLINCFTRFPSVGYKTAERYSYYIIEQSKAEADELVNAIRNVKSNLKLCKCCGNFTIDDVCQVCLERESPNAICVVSHPREILIIEKAKAFSGAYHCLHGTLSPLDRRGPEQLNIKPLLSRLHSNKNIKEVIIALSLDVEGEATANYLANLIKMTYNDMVVSRLATGISMGSSLEYADAATLSNAIRNRRAI
ncbi:MAG: recombination mediator RecR [Christensenellaceae bacterium]|jgi:recombination protein RecR|nr:recombination mediator RecR [Christensenellaceae bacterium]